MHPLATRSPTFWALALVLAMLCLPPSPAAADEVSADSPIDWAADVRFLGRELPGLHPNAFTEISEEEWRRRVADLATRVQRLAREQVVVELHRLVASLRDAHTTLSPEFDAELGIRHYPLELYAFADGIFVRSAAPELSHLVGARVTTIGRAKAEDALAAMTETVSAENEWWARARAAQRLTMPEMLAGLGLVEDMERLGLTVVRDGRQETVTLTPAGPLATGSAHGPQAHSYRSGWLELGRAGGDARPPLRDRQPDRLYFRTFLEDCETLYVRYRMVRSAHRGPSNRQFWTEVFEEADRRRPERLVIDLRRNHGGNGFFNRHVIQQILRRPWLDRPDRLFVIMGRETFSAAQNLVNLLDWWTEATFVGEPSGQRPGLFGDHDALVLPESRISAQVSRLFHQAPNVHDRRPFIAPDLYTPLRSTDLLEGRDPALEAILRLANEPPAQARIERALEAGDIAAAEELLAEARGAEVNRYVRFEAAINRLGYRLLGEHEVARAVEVFELNARSFPSSANVHDSLGEALAGMGEVERALEAYRRALEIDPQLASSSEAVRRLTAHRRPE